MAIIDATDMVLGRMCSALAKRAMLGEKIEVINCEKSVISGNRRHTIAGYVQAHHRGTPFTGPYFPREPDRIVKRTIRGMIPYKKDHGDKAVRRVICYKGVPEQLKGKAAESIKGAKVQERNVTKYITLKDLSKLMGAKE